MVNSMVNQYQSKSWHIPPDFKKIGLHYAQHSFGLPDKAGGHRRSYK